MQKSLIANSSGVTRFNCFVSIGHMIRLELKHYKTVRTELVEV